MSFQTSNGRIYDPSGNVFTARGIGFQDSQLGDANQALADFPGLNFVRLAVYNYQSPSAYASFIQTMTSHGVVVELEDHTNGSGNNGGGRGGAYTGNQLSNELNWYSSVASAYASNPYVWFGTDNEPPNAGLSPWEQQTYNAIRNTGNNNPIMMELPGGGYPSAQNVTDYGMNPSVYASMSNIIVDVHSYGWSSGFSTDRSTVNAALSGLVQTAQTLPSANGTPPVIIGEYGVSTDGSSYDSNSSQVLQAVQQSGQISGGVAWEFTGTGADTLVDGNGNLTGYGQEVQQWIASGTQNSGAASATANSIAGNTATDAPGNTITFSHDNAWGSAVVGNTAYFIDGSNNWIDLTGGSSTITDNGGSNSFILPAASTGSATFLNDILGLGDTVDLQTALAATNWNGSWADLGAYLSVTDTASGATISIAQTYGGSSTQIATIAGETGLDLGGLLSRAVV